MYCIEDEYAAWCFDSAVATFGQALDSELTSVEGKKKGEVERKQTKILEKWIPELRAGSQQRFRDPMELNRGGL